MPRCTRMYIPGLPYHIVQRGNNRDACFIESADYQFYLDLWQEISKTVRGDRSRLLLDDESYPFSYYANLRNQYFQYNQGGRKSICTLYKPVLPAQRLVVGRTASLKPGSIRSLPTRLLPIY